MSLFLAICSKYDEQGTSFSSLSKAFRPAQDIILYPHDFCIVVSLQLNMNFDSNCNYHFVKIRLLIWKTFSNNLGWNGPSEVTCSHDLLRAGPVSRLGRVAQGLVQASFGYLQGGRLYSLFGQCVLVSDYPYWEDFSPLILCPIFV